MADEKKQNSNSSSKSSSTERKSPRSTGGMAPTKTRDISSDTRRKI
ncbi:MAG: hypothetical protein IJT31_03000 [Oscillibacter sp.]|nr:hypothetical protein [Oscillibacter sp.]